MIKLAFPYVEISRDVEGSPDRAWRSLTDTHAWKEWGPLILAVRSPDRFIKKGTCGLVKTALGFWLPFEVTDLDAGSSWSWRINGIKATGHRLERLDERRCRLVLLVPLWAAPYLFVCKIALDRIVKLLN